MKSGIIVIDKEPGYTSFDVVARLRGILHMKKIGHTGTLDPDATGVLPVCIGKATRVCDLLADRDKTYEVTMRLGQRTDTLDASGQILSESPVLCTPEEVESVMAEFLGEISQIPPMYSAVHVDGKRLYEYARQGQTVERPSRIVHIYSISLLEMALPTVKFRVTCSKGTYIRTLSDDIGNRLGCGAVMTQLLRSRVGRFSLDRAYRLSQLETMSTEEIEKLIIPIDQVFDQPAFLVMPEFDAIAKNGGRLQKNQLVLFKEKNEEITIPGTSHSTADFKESFTNGQQFRLYLSDEKFLGIYSYEDGLLKVEKMFLEE